MQGIKNTRAKTKNHKQRFNCFCPAPTGRVRYDYQTCLVWQGTERKVLMFYTCRMCLVCLPEVSGIVETRTLIVMQLSFDTYNFLYLKLTQKLVIYQIYVDCEHLLDSNLNMASLLSVGQNR